MSDLFEFIKSYVIGPFVTLMVEHIYEIEAKNFFKSESRYLLIGVGLFAASVLVDRMCFSNKSRRSFSFASSLIFVAITYSFNGFHWTIFISFILPAVRAIKEKEAASNETDKNNAKDSKEGKILIYIVLLYYSYLLSFI